MPDTDLFAPLEVPSTSAAGRFFNSRALWIFFWVAVVALKFLAILHLRADSDETQHAHVVWAWATGQLQYRDVFDNHMPLFQMACAPLFRLIGERANMLVYLRVAMLSLYFVSLWAVFQVATALFSRKAAPWLTLCAALSPWFFDTSTEFRTDDLWAAFWFLSLVVAVTGKFTVRRALGFGLMLGLVFAVSMKTVVLVIALAGATLIALICLWLRGERPVSAGGLAARAGAILVGIVPAPAAIILFFTTQGAFWIMYYCVVQHNVVPGLKRWGHFSLHAWIFPGAVPVLAAYAWLIIRQARDSALGLRRAIILLTPCLYYCFLLSYWPDITREDDLPYAPLLPLVLVPLLLAAKDLAGRFWPQANRALPYFFPVLACLELAVTPKINNLREDRLRVTLHGISDVLLLTGPNDYVMDNKGDYIFRRRPYYWVLEAITKARLRMGLIHDDLPERLKSTATKICYFYCGHHGTPEAAFIASNYVPFDRQALDVGVAGKEIGRAGAGDVFHFDVAIPLTYSVVSESGITTGTLDGKPYTGPVFLAAGSHQFQRTAGQGRAGIILADAARNGFRPLFQDLDRIAAKQARPE